MTENVPVAIQQAAIDEATLRLESRADQALAQAEEFICASRPEFVNGAAAVRIIVKMRTALETARVSATKPLNESLRVINAWFNGPIGKLELAETKLKGKLAAFESAERERERAEQAKADEEARLQREELQRRAAKAQERGNTERAAELASKAAEVVPAPVDIAPVKGRGMGFGEHWEFEIIRPELIPREYLKPDEVKIGAYVRAMKADARIEGVRIFSRPKVSVRG